MRVALLLALFLMHAPASAISGNEFLALDRQARLTWTVGAVDGILTGLLLATGEQPAMAFCFAKFDRMQTLAIFEKALQERPDMWHHPASFMFYSEFQRLCETD